MRVSDLLTLVLERDPPKGSIVFSVSERRGVVPQEEMFRKKIALDDQSKYVRVSWGDVVYNPYLLWNRAVGVCFDKRGGCVSPAYVVLRPRIKGTERFLHYFLRSEEFRLSVDAIASGSVTRRRTAPITEILDLEFDLAPKLEQIAANSLLTELDSKIELNRQMNETLEGIALAVFKSWFVDFEPVRRKTEGRAPNLASDLWALLPNALDADDVPIEWQRGVLLDLCELKRGYDLPAAQRSPGQYPIISSSGVSGYHSEAMALAPGVVTGRYGTIGEVFFINRPYWPLNTALYVRDFKGNNPRFVYYLLR
jgi:restriction endonuclease S subunit